MSNVPSQGQGDGYWVRVDGQFKQKGSESESTPLDSNREVEIVSASLHTSLGIVSRSLGGRATAIVTHPGLKIRFQFEYD